MEDITAFEGVAVLECNLDIYYSGASVVTSSAY